MKTHGITPYHTSANDEITLGLMVIAPPEPWDWLSPRSPPRELITKKLIQIDDDFYTVCLMFKTASYKTWAVENFIDSPGFEWIQKSVPHNAAL